MVEILADFNLAVNGHTVKLLNLSPRQIFQLYRRTEIVSLIIMYTFKHTFEAKPCKVPLPDQVVQLKNYCMLFMSCTPKHPVLRLCYLSQGTKRLAKIQVSDIQTSATMDSRGLNNKQLIPRHTQQGGGWGSSECLLCYTAL